MTYEDYILHNPKVILPSWDENLRYVYPLSSDSLVVDIGGYVGDYADLMHQKYGCHMAIFEPMPDSYSVLSRRFQGHAKINTYQFGLGSSDREVSVDNAHDATSLLGEAKGLHSTKVRIRQFDMAMKEIGIDNIDLLKINIEGGEYELLPHIIESGWMSKIKHLQIQFHVFVLNSKKQRKTLKEKIHLTHDLKWDKPFVWESWDLR